jgi:hypothetical protein
LSKWEEVLLMVKNIFLAPGWFFYRLITQKRKKFRYLAKPRDVGPIIKLASIFWVGLAMVLWIAVTLLSDSNTATPVAAAIQPAPVPQAQVAAPPQPPVTQVSGTPMEAAPDPAQAQTQAETEAQEGAANTQGEATAVTVTEATQGENLVAGLAPLIVPEELRLGADAVPPTPEAWLVIVESIPKAARDKAEVSLARQKKKGLELVLLDTDAYPRLKSGMWALSMGPFDTKAEAEAAAADIKPKVKDFMVRRGL